MSASDINKIFELRPETFEGAALELYRFQYAHNPLYRRFCDLLRRPVRDLASIPFLPISFFKTHAVQTTEFDPVLRFESSGTTGAQTSRHLVKDADLYNAVAEAAFERLYGPLQDYCILALLPSYLERGQSSLVHMVQHFAGKSGHPDNGFFLYDRAALAGRLAALNAAGQKTLLIGVTYALLDFADAYPMPLPHTVVMETGGMKGRRAEWVRPEVHARLKEAFGLRQVHSEYGMTELLSQAYAPDDGMFVAPPWMRALVSDEDDPASLTTSVTRPRTGRLHVVDLANRWSCAFIATEDIGRQHPDGRFEVLGRMDHSDVRGCSLLAV